jgi:hydrogenase maturation protease
MGVLVIGVGNMQRGDDGVGLLVAQELRAQKLRTLRVEESSGEIAGIVELLRTSEDVIIIDAMRSGKPAGSTVWIDPLSATSFAGSTISSTHGFGVAQAIELLRSLKQLPRRIRILGIEGQYFALGAPVSPPVQEAVKTALSLVLLAVKPKHRK